MNRAFSLIEVLCSILLFLIGILSITILLSSTTALVVTSSYDTRSLTTGKSAMILSEYDQYITYNSTRDDIDDLLEDSSPIISRSLNEMVYRAFEYRYQNYVLVSRKDKFYNERTPYISSLLPSDVSFVAIGNLTGNLYNSENPNFRQNIEQDTLFWIIEQKCLSYKGFKR